MIGQAGHGYVAGMTSDDAENPQAGDPDELLDLQQASELLGVPEEQVRAMSDQELITPQDGGDGPRFRRAELIAARDLGG